MRGTKKYIKNTIRFFALLLLISCSPPDQVDENFKGENPEPTPPVKGGEINMKFDVNYQFLHSGSYLQDRNFYWSTLVQEHPEPLLVLSENENLKSFLDVVMGRIENLDDNSILDASGYADIFKISEQEKTMISKEVQRVLKSKSAEFETLNANHIEQSGVFNHFSSITDSGRVHQLIVEQMIDGINQIIDTYVMGINPTYPDIDKVSYDVNSGYYKLRLKDIASQIANSNYDLFYQPAMEFALGSLKLNNRDEAARFMPLEEGENRAAKDHIKNISWDDYEYSAIAVLGDAPNSPEDLPHISLGGMARADHGVKLLYQGKAPLIIFSGGNVAPLQTEFNEALEMKKYIMEEHGVSENQILIDPYARHTTTNMRNIGRTIYRYGIPVNKKAIVSTTQSQSDYLESDRFSTRNMNEIMHIPMELHDRLSDFDIEFTPTLKVLHLLSNDPLDP